MVLHVTLDILSAVLTVKALFMRRGHSTGIHALQGALPFVCVLKREGWGDTPTAAVSQQNGHPGSIPGLLGQLSTVWGGPVNVSSPTADSRMSAWSACRTDSLLQQLSWKTHRLTRKSSSPGQGKGLVFCFIVKEEIIQIYITILKTVENVSKNSTAARPGFGTEAFRSGCGDRRRGLCGT